MSYDWGCGRWSEVGIQPKPSQWMPNIWRAFCEIRINQNALSNIGFFFFQYHSFWTFIFFVVRFNNGKKWLNIKQYKRLSLINRSYIATENRKPYNNGISSKVFIFYENGVTCDIIWFTDVINRAFGRHPSKVWSNEQLYFTLANQITTIIFRFLCYNETKWLSQHLNKIITKASYWTSSSYQFRNLTMKCDIVLLQKVNKRCCNFWFTDFVNYISGLIFHTRQNYGLVIIRRWVRIIKYKLYEDNFSAKSDHTARQRSCVI